MTSALIVELEFPNTATDDQGNVGFWTIIYNQGFEVVINNRKYFAFSYYKQDGDNVTSICSHTFWGWAHETGVNPADWSCYIGAKIEDRPPKVSVQNDKTKLLNKMFEKVLYSTNFDHIDQINSVQSSWKAGHYEFMNKMTISDLIKMAGGKKSKIAS